MTTTFIAIQEYCARQGQIEPAFIEALHQSGLIQGHVESGDFYINADDLPHIEQFGRFYYDLDINLEGIEAIAHLLSRIEEMQAELNQLSHRMAFYSRLNP